MARRALPAAFATISKIIPPAFRRDRSTDDPRTEVKAVFGDYAGALMGAGLFAPGRSRPWPVERAIADGYERVIYVYRSVETIAGQSSRLKFQLRQGDDTVDDHPLYQLLNTRANPMETGRQFRSRLGKQILLSKRGSFVEVTRARNGTPLRLDLLPPGRTRPVPGSMMSVQATGQLQDRLIDHYETVRADGTRSFIPAESVIWFREPHPIDPYSGVTPLEAAGMSAELDFFARLYNTTFMKNDGRPGGIVGISGDMDDDDMRKLEETFARGPAEAGKLTVVAGEVSYVDSVVRPRDAQYGDMADRSKTEVLCVAAGTLILTKRGMVPVEDVIPGDLVLTHRGRWRPVTHAAGRIPRERVMRVTAKGFDPLTLTETHPVNVVRYFTSKQQRAAVADGAVWLLPGEITPKDRNGNKPFSALTLPALDPAEQTAELDLAAWLSFDPFVREGRGSVSRSYDDEHVYGWNSRSRALPRRIKMGYQFGRLVGLYLAEGHTVNGNGIAWSFHEDETDLHREVCDALSGLFGLEGKVEQRPGKCKHVITRSWALAELLKNGCGTGALHKRIPAWAWHGDAEFLRGLLTGWADGDGCVNKDRMRAVTKSRDLAWGMRVVAASIGVPAGLTSEDRTIAPGRTYKGYALRSNGPMYVLSWRVSETERAGTYRVDDGYLTSPVRSVEQSEYDGPVFNLSVAEDESYATSGGVVHNCAFGVPESMLGNTAGRTFDNAGQDGFNFWTITMPPFLDLQITGFDELSEPELEGFFDVSKVPALAAAEAAKRTEARAEWAAGLINIDQYLVATGKDPWDLPATRALIVANGTTLIPTSAEDQKALGGALVTLGQAPPAPPDAPGNAPDAIGAAASQPAIGASPSHPAPGHRDTGPAAIGSGQPDNQAGQPDNAAIAPAAPATKALPGPTPPRAPRPAPAVTAPSRVITGCEVKAAPRPRQPSSPNAGGSDDGEDETDRVPADEQAERLEAALALVLAALAARWAASALTPDPQLWQAQAQAAVTPLIMQAATIAAARAHAALGGGALQAPDPAETEAEGTPGGLDPARDAAGAVIAMVGTAAAALALRLAATPGLGIARESAVWAAGIAVHAATATVNAAADLAATVAARLAGRLLVRVWRTRRDTRVRETHRLAEGQRRPPGVPFIVGGEPLMFPGDPAGSPAETYGCRCKVTHKFRIAPGGA